MVSALQIYAEKDRKESGRRLSYDEYERNHVETAERVDGLDWLQG